MKAFALALFSLLAGCSSPPSVPDTTLTTTPTVTVKPIIYDTDMAIDDWSALLYLARHPALDLRAVTLSTSGETHCTPGQNNVASLLDLSTTKTDITIACGDAEPMDGYFVFPTAWQKDADTLSGVPVQPSQRPLSDHHAVDIIHATLQASSQPVTIVAVGPLTNIAQWLQRYPDDRAKLDELIIMGGNLYADGNMIVPGFTDDHPNIKAEWNIWIDPVAAQYVFQSGLPLTMVGLDATNQVQVTPDFVQRFARETNSDAARFFNQVFEKNDGFIDSGEYYFWDVLAAVITTNPELCIAQTLPVQVTVDYTDAPDYLGNSDLTMPTTTALGPRQHLNAQRSGITQVDDMASPVNVCLNTDRTAVLDQFIQTLQAP